MIALRIEDLEVEWAKRFYSKRLSSLEEMFGVKKPIIGMIHVPPLPGSPGYEGEDMEDIIEFSLRDARILVENGVDGLIVENMWDLPYYTAENVPPWEIAALAVITREVVKTFSVPVGINIVHNGYLGEISIAKAAGAKFMRVCIHAGVQVWDTGDIDRGHPADLLRIRKFLYAEDVKLFADITKKHAVMFPGIDIRTHAEWTDFYMADALIVTGTMTGKPPTVEDVKVVKEFLPERPVLIGSGSNPENIKEFLKYADGAIVGTYFKVKGITQNPVDPERVRKFMSVVKEVRKKYE